MKPSVKAAETLKSMGLKEGLEDNKEEEDEEPRC